MSAVAAPRAAQRSPLPLGIAVGASVLTILALLPYLTSSFHTSLAVNVLMFGLMAMSLDILVGYTGLFSLGHATYFGLGAYGVAYAEKGFHGPLYATGYAVLLVVIVALAFGLIAVRVTGITFAIVTMALGGIVWGLAYRWVKVSGGDNGLPIPVRPKPFGIALTAGDNFYYFVLIVFIACAGLMQLLVRSPFGLTLRGIKDNEPRMRTLGYNVALHKYLAFVIAGIFSGIGGVLFGFYNMYVTPASLDLYHNFVAAMMVVIGGVGTLWGGFVGGAVVVLMQYWLSLYVDRWSGLMGVVFVLVVLFARRGLFGTALYALQLPRLRGAAEVFGRWRRRRS